MLGDRLNSRKQLQAERVRAEESNEHAPPASFLQRLKQTKSNQDLTDAGARRTIVSLLLIYKWWLALTSVISAGDQRRANGGLCRRG